MATTPTTAPGPLLETPLHAMHLERGAKMVDFTGWHMPLHYGSILDEHHQVRTAGGLFDVSHMGRLEFTGRDAGRFLDHICTRSIQDMQAGQARYGLVCNERGGCRDDVLVYRLDDTTFLMVCNASNRAKLLQHFAAVKGDMTFRIEDLTTVSAMIAVQGPGVIDAISRFSSEIPTLKRYRFCNKSLLGLDMLISRTGYTGEDGVEIIFRTDGFIARTVMKQAMKELAKLGDAVKPAGLGARDSLRLEAGMPLYGHEIDEETDPLTAGLAFAVKLDKEAPYIGQAALQSIAAQGPARRLVGLVLDGRRAARQHMSVFAGDTTVGTVTSGCLSPTLDKSIAMAIVDTHCAVPGTALDIDLGRQRVHAEVTGLPFVKK